MDVVRDVLDKPAVDRHGHDMGRIDNIMVEWRDGQPPLLRAIEIGPVPLAYRLWSRLGPLVHRIEARVGAGERRPIRVPLVQCLVKDNRVVLSLNAGETGSANVELAARRLLRRCLPWK